MLNCKVVQYYTVLSLLIAVLLLTGVQYNPLAGVVYLLHFHCKLVAHATYKITRIQVLLGIYKTTK